MIFSEYTYKAVMVDVIKRPDPWYMPLPFLITFCVSTVIVVLFFAFSIVY